MTLHPSGSFLGSETRATGTPTPATMSATARSPRRHRVDAHFKAGKNDAFVAETRISDIRCVLAIPVTFMNKSGQSAASLIKRFGITDSSRLIVVHDELDLEPGDTRLKMGGASPDTMVFAALPSTSARTNSFEFESVWAARHLLTAVATGCYQGAPAEPCRTRQRSCRRS